MASRVMDQEIISQWVFARGGGASRGISSLASSSEYQINIEEVPEAYPVRGGRRPS